MLNLLFISDSPKVEYMKNVLQPDLKVIIDVVTDFDRGLKDVFEKRPSTVYIQDQIGGVTGESVARHIQMLLGNGAPTFILLHTGNSKARVIKGLYKHLIDLSQPNETVAEQLISTFKSLLGDQWERGGIPSKQPRASLRSSVAVPEGSREDADKFVDDFLSDLETSGTSDAETGPPAVSTVETVLKKSSGPELCAPPPHTGILFGNDESDHVQTTSDEMAELFVAKANKATRDESPAAASSGVNAGSAVGSNGAANPAAAAVTQRPPAVSVLPASPEASSDPPHTESPVVSRSAKKDIQSAPTAARHSQTTGVPAKPAIPGTPVTPAAAAFRISHNTAPAEEPFPEELLMAFEENYRSESLFFRRSVVITLVCVVFAAGGWYLVKKKPLLLSSLKQRLLPPFVAKQAPVPGAIPAQNPPPPPLPPPVVTLPLPAFIPKEGHDTAYAVHNPGWERYVGKDAEFRVFSASGRIQAVQVLSVKDAFISGSLMASVLKEFTGSSEYQITSRNTKAGVRVENGRIQNRGEVIIYRKNGAVTAFVVSIN